MVYFFIQPPQANAKPTERFGYVIDGLCRSANVFMSVLGHALVALIEGRLRRLQTRFNRLAAALAAGTPRRALASRAGVAGRPRPAFMGPVLRLPPDPGWLIRLSPWTAIRFAADLEHLLTTDGPTMALVASDARFGRILRPLFHMIGRDPPACVPALPPPAPRARKPRAARARRRGAPGQASDGAGVAQVFAVGGTAAVARDQAALTGRHPRHESRAENDWLSARWLGTAYLFRYVIENPRGCGLRPLRRIAAYGSE